MAAGYHSFTKGSIFTPERFQGDRFMLVGVRANAIDDSRKPKIVNDFQCATAFLHDAFPGQPRRVEMYDHVRGEIPFSGTHLIGISAWCFTNLEHGAIDSNPQTLKFLTKALGEISVQWNEDNLVSFVTIPHKAFKILSDLQLSTSQLLDFQPQLQRSEAFVELPHFFPIVGLIPGMESPLIDLSSAPTLLDVLDAKMIPPSRTPKPRPTTCIFYVVKNIEHGNSEEGLIYHDLAIRGLGIDGIEELASSTGACTLAAYLALQQGGPSAYHVFNFVQMVPGEDRRSLMIVQVGLDADGKSIVEVILSGRAMFYYRGVLHGAWH